MNLDIYCSAHDNQMLVLIKNALEKGEIVQLQGFGCYYVNESPRNF